MRPPAVGYWRTHSGFLNSGLQLDRGMTKATDNASASVKQEVNKLVDQMKTKIEERAKKPEQAEAKTWRIR